MSALQLTPKGCTYLRTDISEQQLSQNSIELTLDSDNAVATSDTPKLKLDGTGRAYLTGAIRLAAGSPTAGDTLFTLPRWVIPEKDFFLTALKEATGTGVFSGAGVNILNDSSGVEGATVDIPGSYQTMPTIGLTGNGSGAVLVPRAYALSATLLGNPTGDTSNAPGDLITLADSSSTEIATVLSVTNTGVYSATITAGGTGGTPGTQTVTGTTGTGTKFTASVTVSGGGVITAILSIVSAGVYTVNPTLLTAEPVTGASLVGATLNIHMKPVTLAVQTAGSYLNFSTPISQSGTANPSGAGGCTFSVLWGLLSLTATSAGTGYDDTSGIAITGGGGSGGGAATLILSDVGTVASQSTGVLAISASTNDVLHLDGAVFFVKSY
jgi:hypothetical protein